MSFQEKTKLTAVILAGGRGRRMEGDIPKVLIDIEGKPMIKRVVDAVSINEVKQIIVVVGMHYEKIKNVLPEGIKYAFQKEPKGTADAFIKALDIINDEDECLILPADLPYIDELKIKKIIEYYQLAPMVPLVVGMNVKNPTGYGRLLFNGNELNAIIEEKETNELQKKILTINTGIYVFPARLIRPLINKLKPHLKEFYLTDLIALLSAQSSVRTIIFPEDYRLKGVNHLSDLQSLLKEKNK